VDPIGACVGLRGTRIQVISRELRGEKIDIIEWSHDPATFVARALSPAKVSSVTIDDEPDVEGQRSALVIVPDNQLSLAIGKKGQNARLAAKLTGMRIDIKSESEVEAEAAEADTARAGREALERFPELTPGVLERLMGAGLGTPSAIVDAGIEKVRAVIEAGEHTSHQADTIFTAAQEWMAVRSAASGTREDAQGDTTAGHVAADNSDGAPGASSSA
jgi:transcription termination/antitermination protein NusA